MKILILGAAGFVGQNLYYHYCDNHEVTAVDNFDPYLKSSHPDFYVQVGDVRKGEDMAKYVRGQDVIINCAAQTSHPLSMSAPTLDTSINCTGNLVLLEAIRDHNSQAIVIYPSSTTVVGPGLVNNMVQEHPLDIYSANKLVAEKYYQIYHKAYGLRTFIIRFPNLYGPHGKGSPEFGFVNYFIYRALSGQPITIYGEGSQLRSVLYIKDALKFVDFMMGELAESSIGQVRIAASNSELSVSEIALTIAKVFGGEVQHVDWPENRRRIDVGDVKVKGIYRPYGWWPEYSFRAGLEDMLE